VGWQFIASAPSDLSRPGSNSGSFLECHPGFFLTIFGMVTSVDSLAKQFWAALARGDGAAARRIGAEMEVVAPNVEEPTFDFPDSPSSQAGGER